MQLTKTKRWAACAAIALIPLITEAAGPKWASGAVTPTPKQKNKSSFYAGISPDVGLMNMQTLSFGAHNTEAMVSTSFDNSCALRFGFSEEMGAHKIFRLKAREHFNIAHTTAQFRTMQIIACDIDSAFSFFIPIGERSHLLITGGYEYFYSHARNKKQGFDTYYTPWIFRAYGPFAGLGFSLNPAQAIEVEAGAAYHIPRGVGQMRALGSGGLIGPGEWMRKIHYKGAGSGCSAYMDLKWRASDRVTFVSSLEAKQLCAAGNTRGAPSSTAAENRQEVMNVTYVTYTAGAAFRF